MQHARATSVEFRECAGAAVPQSVVFCVLCDRAHFVLSPSWLYVLLCGLCALSLCAASAQSDFKEVTGRTVRTLSKFDRVSFPCACADLLTVLVNRRLTMLPLLLLFLPATARCRC